LINDLKRCIDALTALHDGALAEFEAKVICNDHANIHIRSSSSSDAHQATHGPTLVGNNDTTSPNPSAHQQEL
jgi:hypothetical protein